MKPGKTGLARIVDAFGYSMKGLRFAYKNEAAFRQEIAAAIILLPVAVWLADTALQFAVLILPIFIVLLMELVNSAIEAVVDRIGSEKHLLSGAAKDIGSAAVLLSVVLLFIVWVAFLWQKFL